MQTKRLGDSSLPAASSSSRTIGPQAVDGPSAGLRMRTMQASVQVPELPSFIARRMPFARRMVSLEQGPDAGRQIHLVDHGPTTGRPVLLLHGNPTWSFLWRKVITALEASSEDFRCVAPDLLGLGLSSKLPSVSDHAVTRHADAIGEVVDQLGLRDVILVIQDWGGPVGVAMAARRPETIAGVVVANTAVVLPKRPRGTRFHRFARMPIVSDAVFRGLGFPLGILHKAQGDPASIRGEVVRAYRWPLRRMRDRVAPLALARMVPDAPEHASMPAMLEGQDWLTSFPGPIALVWGERDPILGRALKRHALALPDAAVHRTQAGHFLQEEVPEVLAAAVCDVDRRLG